VVEAIILLWKAAIAVVVFVDAMAIFIMIPAPTPSLPANCTRQQLDYFTEIAFALPEYGDMNKTVCKWDDDLHINITGTPEYSDIDAVLSAIGELKGLTGDITLLLNDSDANVVVYVGPGE
jgi:hypothetical protein